MSWNCLSSSTPKGRTEYRCDLCGLRIHKGAKHVHITGTFDGEFMTCRRHAVCSAAAEEFDEMDCEERTSGDEPEFRRYDLHLPLIEGIEFTRRQVGVETLGPSPGAIGRVSEVL